MKTKKIGVLGLGYVGLPLCREFVRGGAQVLGFDIDAQKIEQLNAGKTYIEHISDETIGQMRESGRFEATDRMERLSEPDAILIAVPTPLNKMREPDLRFVESSCRAIGTHLRKGQLVVLESTTYPGTTREVMLPILEEASGLKAGEDFYLAYSPEREDPGRKDFGTRTIPKVIGGYNPASLEAALEIYELAVDHPVPVSSCEVAEAAKILENTYRSVNIALVNELKQLFDRMEIDIWEVIDAAKTKPFGFTPFYPGPGLGGHCIPIDPFYLTWKARAYDQTTRFIELAGEVNTAMPEWVVGKVIRALNEHKKPLNGSRILILGMAYKPNVDDDRESPSYKLMDLLRERGAELAYHDPHIPEIRHKRDYPHYTGMRSLPLGEATVASFDCVLIATHHDAVDYALVERAAQLIVDTRNVLPASEKTVKA